MKKHKRKKQVGGVVSTKEVPSSASSSIRNPQSAIRNRIAERLRSLTFVLILACVAGRAFIAEMPFRHSPVQISEVMSCVARGETSRIGLVNYQELARVTLATVLLSACAVWLIAGAAEGQLRFRRGWLAVLLGGLAAWSFASACGAKDARSAWLVWLEQLALLSAAFVMIQLCSSRRRFVLIAATLAAVGLCLALKGWYQAGWEGTDGIKMFQQYGLQRLADMGMTPDDPKTKAYIQKIMSPVPTGYFGLSEVLSTVLALTLAAAVGLAAAKVAYAYQRRRRDGAMPAGQIHPAFLAAVLTTATTLPIAVIQVLARSRGGVGAAGIVLLATLIGLRFRATLARQWKLAAVSAGVLLAVLLAGVAAYGLARDRLPGGKTMSIRWFYWTGAAQMVRENPLWGVGPGNFSRAYLEIRRPEAEEAVKTPHNVIAHALAQFGLPGGCMYLAFLGGMIVLAWKPAMNVFAKEGPGEASPGRCFSIPTLRDTKLPGGAPALPGPTLPGGAPALPGPTLPGGAPALPGQATISQRSGAGAPPRYETGTSLRSILLPMLCITLGVFFCRYFFGGVREDSMLLILEGVVPTVVFAIALGLERWFGAALENVSDVSIRLIRLAVAAGCSAFLLHNMVTYSLWMPGAAGLFWVGLAAAVAGGEAREIVLRRSRAIPAAVLGTAGVVAAGILFITPVANCLTHTQKAVDAMLRHNPRLAVEEAKRAARSDPLDAQAAMNAARFCLVTAARHQKTAADVWLPMAWAQEAIERNDDANSYRTAAQVARELKLPEADVYWRGAIQRDPADARVYLDYAVWLIDQKRTAEAGAPLDKAERIDQQLRTFNPESIYLLSENEKRQITELRRKVGVKQ